MGHKALFRAIPSVHVGLDSRNKSEEERSAGLGIGPRPTMKDGDQQPLEKSMSLWQPESLVVGAKIENDWSHRPEGSSKP
ncbi:hypothetical protein FQN60_002147 [Etheostoma spectabile]|uniref:Uncharacterized protein n=1 Tax=Etheostoma spectabile TaxID=54343 RepID=A0A5J5DBZ4_9PERO|nr:hypothetical protein FQN60_002147 [Etheostoma spectabile]